MRKLLSFVIPCYRSEQTIEPVIAEIIEVVASRPDYDYEIIAVNDCSPDNVYEVLARLAAGNPRIRVINLAINAGKHTAVLAGYRACRGDYVVDLDDDMQCPMQELWRMVELLERDECDFVTAAYYKKQESRLKRLGSRFNSYMVQKLLGKPRDLRLENFSVKKLFVAKEVARYKNIYPYLEGLILKVTRRIKTVPMHERARGDNLGTGFTFIKSVNLLLNGMTAFSVKPLRLMTYVGGSVSFCGMLWGLYVVVRKILNPDILAGYSSLIAVNLFIGGLLMIMLGILGEYIGRIFICMNSAAQYVVRSTINLDNDEVTDR